MLIFTLAVCLFLGHVSNATSFTPTCTVPPPETNYVGGTGIRSTMSIIWNCISIFILCTWSIQHLNIPAGRPPTKHFGKWLWWQILDLGTRVKWMVIIILVPEFLIGKGFAEWSATKSSLNLTFNSAVWTETHVRMANLGYFVLDFSDLLPTQEEREAFFTRVEAVRERLNSSGAINCSRLKHRAWALNDTQWNYAAAGHNGVADLPDVSRRQLEALNRVDAMANFLAILQVIYLIIQLIARKVQGVASTQLEIAALAYSATSLFTFILFWDQPQSVQSRYLVKARELPSDRLIRVIANWGPTYVWIGLRPHARVDSELDLAPIPNDGTNQHPYEVPWLHSTLNNYIRAYGREVLPLALGSLLGGTVFGGFHCIAWNYEFPTSVEALLWRICSVFITVLPLASVPMLAFWAHLFRDSYYIDSKTSAVGFVLFFGFLLPYILARVFLMVEIFRSLFFLPPDAFIDTWSGSFPHWG